jgi:L-alanine-DL-glutamate epimerase-like enolase superfamily enzyme
MPDPLRVTVWHVPTPLPRPVLTPAGPYDTFFHLVVVAEDGDGNRGWGYSGLASLELLDAAAEQAARWQRDRPHTLPALLGIEQVAAAEARDQDHGGSAAAGTARNAASTASAVAGWDRAGRRLGVACADLWGRRPGTEAVPAYASGFFLDGSLDALRDEAAAFAAAGYQLVKMRVGLDVDADLERLAAVRAVFGAPGAVAVDAVNAWTPDQTHAFVRRAGVELLWVEDPTPYAELDQVAGLAAPLAAGESIQTIEGLVALTERARLDAVLLDVQQLGGPTRFFEAAHALASRTRIGAHIYTAQSAHLLACVDHPLPLEAFDWSDSLFVQPPAPGRDGRVAITGPGFGVELNDHTLHDHGHAIA